MARHICHHKRKKPWKTGGNGKRRGKMTQIHQTRPINETYKRDPQKRPTKQTHKKDLMIMGRGTTRSCASSTCRHAGEEKTHTFTLSRTQKQKRPTKRQHMRLTNETYNIFKRDLHRRPTDETDESNKNTSLRTSRRIQRLKSPIKEPRFFSQKRPIQKTYRRDHLKATKTPI